MQKKKLSKPFVIHFWQLKNSRVIEAQLFFDFIKIMESFVVKSSSLL